MEKLDKIDYKILELLDRNARLPISDVSRAVRYGRDLVNYRITRMFDIGVVRRARAVLSSEALGFMKFKTYLKLRNCAEIGDALAKRITTHPATYCYADCDGNWDFIFNMVARRPMEFDTELDKLLAPFQRSIAARDTALVLKQLIFPRKYLGTGTPYSWELKDSSSPCEIGELETTMLQQLVNDARISLVELAEICNSSPTIIKRRIAELETAQVITGYRLDIDRKKIGYSSFKAQVDFSARARPQFNKLALYCKNHPQVMSFIHQLGRCRLELNIDAKDYDHFSEITDHIAREFPDLIESISMLGIREERFIWLMNPLSSKSSKVPIEIGLS